jgi:hypothetical protein
VPTNADWYVGKSFSGKISQMAFVDLQPKGVVFNPTQSVQSAVAPMANFPLVNRVAAFTPGPIPVLPPFTGKTVDLDESVPAPVQEFAQPTANADELVGGTTDAGLSGLKSTNVGAFSTTSGAASLGPSLNSATTGAAAAISGAANAAALRGPAGAGFAPAVSTPTNVITTGSVLNINTVPSGINGVGALVRPINAGGAQFGNALNNTLNNLGGIKLP